MRGQNPDSPCALGLAPHSGWAAAVLLQGPRRAPRVLARERLVLADPALEGSRQPFHALEALALPEAHRRLARFEAAALALATAALGQLGELARRAGTPLVAAGILDSAARSGATLEAILASHALIHSADGHHFRAALAQAGAAQGLTVTRIAQRDLPGRAQRALGRSEGELGREVARLGHGLGAPWGADQKCAALLAWLLLADAG